MQSSCKEACMPKGSDFIRWVQVIRPKTLTAALIPFIGGACLAHSRGASIRWVLLISAILSGLCIQIGSNLINDAADFEKGADDDQRLGPQRAIQQGMATTAQVYWAGLASFLMALVFAIPLMQHGGISIILVLLASIAAAYCYTAGPYPLAYGGWGELFVLIFFGWVATGAGYWIQSGVLDLSCFVLGTQIGLLCMVLIAINNLRDIKGDAKVGKRTLAVRFGPAFARYEITAAIYLPYMLTFYWLMHGDIYAAALPWGAFFVAAALVRKVWGQEPSRAYNQYFGLAALLHLSFGLLIGIGFLLN
jgi:1,4-dihydroxy-2-naphthoate octaprenyltransferase